LKHFSLINQNKIMLFFSTPIIVMNWTSGTLGGIWLVVLGEWELIFIGFVLFLVSEQLLALLLMPGALIMGAGVEFFERKRLLGTILLFISNIYTQLLVVLTCFVSFVICSSFYKGNSYGDNSIEYIPYLLWSWGMALGPWQFFASKDTNDSAVITTISASFLYFLFLLSAYFNATLASFSSFLLIMVHMIVLPIFYIIKMHQLRNDDESNL
jgi:hypothetical protein